MFILLICLISLGSIVPFHAFTLSHVPVENESFRTPTVGKVFGPKIWNGQDALPGEFPWMVQLAVRNAEPNTYQHFCGGSIIAADWVLTAAHCLPSSGRLGNFTILAGSVESADVSASTYEIEKVIGHPKPLPHGVSSPDIGLIKVRQPFKFNQSMQPIKLANFELPINTTVTVSGFGFNEDRMVPHRLQKVNLTVGDIDICTKGLNAVVSPRHQILEDEKPYLLCLMMGKNGQTTNGGDSGSPVVYYDQSGAPHQVGVVSFISSADFPVITFHNKVHFFRGWIVETMAFN